MTGEIGMSEPHDCGGDAGAYVLGALEPREAERFRRHLETCDACRDEVAHLEQVTEKLPLAAPQLRPRSALKRRVMAEVRADRGKSRRGHSNRVLVRRSVLAGGLALLAALAVLTGVQALSPGGGPAVRVYSATVGDAQLRVTSGHGELVVDRLPQPTGNRIYEVWLKRRHSPPVPTKALFSVTSGGQGDVDVPGDLRGVTEVLVTEEPAGGTVVPTSAPVIVAPLD